MQTIVDEDSFVSTSSYHMFTYSIRNEVTRKYYERRLKRFFDFIGFDLQTDLEERCNSFVRRGIAEGEWAISQIISFLQFEKERVLDDDM